MNLKSLLFLLYPIISFSQDKITVAINSKDTFIETHEYNKPLETFLLKDAYRLGPSSTKLLKQGIATCIKWVKLNQEHKKNFEKEVVRFKVISKTSFNTFGYHESLVNEAILNFKGYEDNSFEIKILTQNIALSEFIKINSLSSLYDFESLLEGKTLDNEIDKLFIR